MAEFLQMTVITSGYRIFPGKGLGFSVIKYRVILIDYNFFWGGIGIVWINQLINGGQSQNCNFLIDIDKTYFRIISFDLLHLVLATTSPVYLFLIKTLYLNLYFPLERVFCGDE